MQKTMSSEESRTSPPTALFASIDIGSHTTRMLIASKQGDRLIPLCSQRRVTRLAQDFQKSGEIVPAAQTRNLSALQEYSALLQSHGVQRLACGATGVLRRARNRDAVLSRIAEKTRIVPEVLSEEAEAILSAKGILSVLPRSDGNVLSFDVGGGSTEFLLATSGASRPAWTASRPVGAATLTEKYLSGDPPGPVALEASIISARAEILSAREDMHATLCAKGISELPGPLLLAGTAGTVTTLAAMHLGMTRYAPSRVNGTVLTSGFLSSLLHSFCSMRLEDRRRTPGLERGREDIILGGAVIVDQILACFGSDRFVAIDAGLMEGLLLGLVEREYLMADELTTGLTWLMQKG
ncbi:MAG: hypothetical protein LLG06_07340 [Desulfobacteraceae bacterium]|nr:hypothetical protein [Desulfobacteraceae bacterium]